MKETALFLNIPEPTPSLYGESSQLSNIKPTTGEVIGAYTEEIFTGEGSLAQDIEASNIRKQERRGISLSQEDWKASPNYRDGLNWYDGITAESAATLARIEDDRQERSIVMERASGLQTGAGMATSFVAGIFEPKNLASGVAAALVTGGAGMAIPSLGRLIATNTVRGAAIRGGIEGAVAAGAVEYSNIESSKIVQGDYTMADSLLNFGLSTILGAGIGAGVKKLELRADVGGKTPRAYRPETEELAVKEYDTALAQMVEGQEVDVTAVKAIDNAEKVRKAQKELPALNKKIDESYQKLTPVTERPEFKKWFEGSKVVDADGRPLVVYHGTKADFEAFNPVEQQGTKGIWFTKNPETASRFTNRGEGDSNVIPAYMKIENPYIHDPKTNMTMKQVFDEARKGGYDGVALNKGEAAYIAFKPEQVKSIFNRGAFDPNDPRLIDIKKAEELQVRKGELESDLARTVDQESITNLQNKVSNPANSSVYDEISPDIIKDFKQSSIEDDIAMERSLEAMQEEVQALYDQGLLNDEEIRTLESLADIDDESAIFDNVLLNAKNCLLR